MKKNMLILLFAILFFSTAGLAQHNKLAGGVAVIKVGAVSGASTNPKYKGWTDLRSFYHQKAGAGQRGEWIEFEVKEDDTTASLSEAFVEGRIFPKVEVEVTAPQYDDGFVAYKRYDLADVKVTSYSVVDNLGGIVVLCRLSYQKSKRTSHDRDASGRAKSTVLYTWTASRESP